MRYVTTFSTEIFSLLNSIIYFHKAVQELQRAQRDLSFAAFLYSVIGAIGTFIVAVFLSSAESWKPLFHRYIRMGLREYAAAISIIIFIGLPHVGQLADLDKETLHVTTSFRPTSPDRTVFFVQFWRLPITWVFAALVPGSIITVLFFFDHEVSSIICTIDRYGTRKPGGFAWDIVLLGTTTALCGILGIPPANGLLPQAPLHSESLMHDERENISMMGSEGEPVVQARVSRRVYEQLTQIVVTTGIFIMTLTVAGPAFPIIIIALVPVRLLLMNRVWNRRRSATSMLGPVGMVRRKTTRIAGVEEKTSPRVGAADIEGGVASIEMTASRGDRRFARSPEAS
ncbi:hypothetical protein H2199_006574 [Coniosporium tulheliwenetii]|uniref:Uncharacterized protein n=1 Tax=Coniosporium tulheliwenetii TaxID=3383036 RepID=A0ACC2YVU9_9PEZI|nr:hypothetical protein H2199_006574 [Cladosporium sp. JES 115]